MPLALFGLSYKTAPLELRERVAFDSAALLHSLPGLTCVPHVREAVVVSTCHRTEIYTELTDMDAAKQHAMAWLADERGIPRRTFNAHVYHRFDADAARHLFRVTAGLDSMVIGEAQILGQVREAFKVATRAQTVRAKLDTTFRQALKVGKRARTETSINRYASSLGSVAADLAEQALGSLQQKRILVLGAGEMAKLAVTHLVSNGATQLVVANRSLHGAERLEQLPGVTTARLAELARLLPEVDILIASTGSSSYLVTPEMLRGRNRPLVIVDLGLPRDVDPAVGDLPGARLYNVDQLDQALARGRHGQEEDVAQVERIIDTELLAWQQWQASQGAIPTIAALQARAAEVREGELRKALAKLAHLSERDRQEVAALAGAVSAKLLHLPMQRLKRADLGSGYLDVARDLFGLEGPQATEDDEAATLEP